MELKVDATVHLKEDDVKQIIKEYVETQTGKQVSSININIRESSDDRFHYSPAGINSIDVKVKL